MILGQIGETLAGLAGDKEPTGVVVFDSVKGSPKGKVPDLPKAMSVTGADADYARGSDYRPLCGADVVIIIVGVRRQSGKHRNGWVGIKAEEMIAIGQAPGQRRGVHSPL